MHLCFISLISGDHNLLFTELMCYTAEACYVSRMEPVCCSGYVCLLRLSIRLCLPFYMLTANFYECTQRQISSIFKRCGIHYLFTITMIGKLNSILSTVWHREPLFVCSQFTTSYADLRHIHKKFYNSQKS